MVTQNTPSKNSPGNLLKNALRQENPLQLVGTINAFTALLAQKHKFKALYLSGAGIANANFGLPDLGLTNLSDVLDQIYKITAVVSVPLLVDADTGFGSVLNIQQTVKGFIQAGAAGLHLEDQSFPKRCGHRPGKKLIEVSEMQDRLKAALDARTDPSFMIMARTDAFAEEGLEKTLERAKQYEAVGIDSLFLEGATALKDYEKFTKALKIPVLANITEFGVTPLLTVNDLKTVGVQMVLYPLTAFRAMNKAAELVYATVRKEGTQKNVMNSLQTRAELYEVLHYEEYEKQI